MQLFRVFFEASVIDLHLLQPLNTYSILYWIQIDLQYKAITMALKVLKKETVWKYIEMFCICNRGENIIYTKKKNPTSQINLMAPLRNDLLFLSTVHPDFPRLL